MARSIKKGPYVFHKLLKKVEAAKALYYQMAGWDEGGRPTRGKLEELALGWVADELAL